MTHKFVIVDLECTCDDQERIPREECEIIEIGAVAGSLLEDKFFVQETFQHYVKPQMHTNLTPFCSRLTGISQDQVDSSESLIDVLPELQAWLSDVQAGAWGSWGKFDKTQFDRELIQKGLENPWSGLKHLNVKQLFARKRKHRVGLKMALALSGMQFEGRLHSGIDDAKNIARLLNHDALMRDAIVSRI